MTGLIKTDRMLTSKVVQPMLLNSLKFSSRAAIQIRVFVRTIRSNQTITLMSKEQVLRVHNRLSHNLPAPSQTRFSEESTILVKIATLPVIRDRKPEEGTWYLKEAQAQVGVSLTSRAATTSTFTMRIKIMLAIYPTRMEGPASHSPIMQSKLIKWVWCSSLSSKYRELQGLLRLLSRLSLATQRETSLEPTSRTVQDTELMQCIKLSFCSRYKSSHHIILLATLDLREAQTRLILTITGELITTTNSWWRARKSFTPLHPAKRANKRSEAQWFLKLRRLVSREQETRTIIEWPN